MFDSDTCPAGTYCDTNAQIPNCGAVGCTLDGTCAADPSHVQATCHVALPD